MVVRIDKARERERAAEGNLRVAARSAGNDFAYPLPLDDHVANAGAAEDFHVAQNYHDFMKCIPNTSGCPLCFSYAFKYCARSNNGRTDSSIARSAAKTAVSPHSVAM